MHVTLLCSRFRPEGYGGVEERLWRTTQALARCGAEVQVLTENRVNAPEVENFAPGTMERGASSHPAACATAVTSEPCARQAQSENREGLVSKHRKRECV